MKKWNILAPCWVAAGNFRGKSATLSEVFSLEWRLRDTVQAPNAETAVLYAKRRGHFAPVIEEAAAPSPAFRSPITPKEYAHA